MAFGVTLHGKGAFTGTSPQTTTINVPSGATALYVSVSWNGGMTITGATYAGSSMGTALAAVSDNAGSMKCSLYRVISPTSGSNDIVITWSADPGAGANTYYLAVSQGDTSTANRTVQTRFGDASAGPGITDGNWVSGDIELHALSRYDLTIAWDSGETSVQDENEGGSGFSAGLSYKTTNGTVGATDTSYYAEIACAMIPAVAGSTITAAGGSHILSGIATVLRVGSTVWLRYRK